MIRRIIPILAALALAGCISDPVDVDDVLRDFDKYAGNRVLLKTKFRSGARCRIGDEAGQWKTYCKGDCQYCSGPIVVDSNVKPKEAGLDDWPMILGGTHDDKPMRCEGLLNRVKCTPFKLGETYIVRGIIAKHAPARLIVKEFWLEEDY